MKNQSTITQDEWEEIERYLSGEMSPDESANFNARLKSDPILKEKLNEVKLTLTGIREAVLQEKLDSFHQHISPKVTPRQVGKQTRMLWLAAASVLLAITVTVVFLSRNNENETLFVQYFETDPGLATAMSTSEDYDFNRGMVDYKTSEYKNAIDTWKKLLVAKPNNDTLHYFIGVSYLALKETDSAVYHLKETTEIERSSFRSDAFWFLGLALLKENKQPEAVTYLRQSTHPKKDELLLRLK